MNENGCLNYQDLMTKTYIVSSLLKSLDETTVLILLMYSYVIWQLGDAPVRLIWDDFGTPLRATPVILHI